MVRRGTTTRYFKIIAHRLIANEEGSSILRIGWEFNGNWTPWYADAEEASAFVSFWQQIVTTMRSVSGADFKFEWCPDIGSSVGNLANFYPGNAYVDYVAEDVYDQAWGTYPGRSNRVLRPRDPVLWAQLAHLFRRAAG